MTTNNASTSVEEILAKVLEPDNEAIKTVRLQSCSNVSSLVSYHFFFYIGNC